MTFYKQVFHDASLLLAAVLLVGMRRFTVAVLMRVVPGRLFSVFLGVASKPVGRVAVVGDLLMVALLKVLSSGAVLQQRVLEIVGSLFVGCNNFLVPFGMVSHGLGGKR